MQHYQEFLLDNVVIIVFFPHTFEFLGEIICFCVVVAFQNLHTGVARCTQQLYEWAILPL